MSVREDPCHVELCGYSETQGHHGAWPTGSLLEGSICTGYRTIVLYRPISATDLREVLEIVVQAMRKEESVYPRHPQHHPHAGLT